MMKFNTYIPLLVASSTLAALTCAKAETTPAAKNAKIGEQAPPKASISPQELAKTKNVPASIKDPDGDYTLVAVVEGAEANRKLTQSLQVVGAQRQRLAQLSRQFEQTATNLPQQRELLATQINQLNQTLSTNLLFMSKNFAYSLNYSYIMIPHESSLVAVTQKDGKTETKTVYSFKNADSYVECQEKRNSYLQLKQKQANANAKKTGDTSPEAAAKLKPTAEMEKIRKDLIKLYKFDPEKNYQINFEKTAIYARKVG